MRASWLQIVGCLTLVALGVNSVSAAVRAKPHRLRELDVQIAQADTRIEVVPPRVHEKSSTAGEGLIPLSPSAFPNPPREPGPPAPRYEHHVPHHPPHMGNPPHLMNPPVIHESHSTGCCTPAPQACGCSSMMQPVPLMVHRPLPVASCCSSDGHHFQPNGFNPFESMGGFGVNTPGYGNVGGLHPAYSTAFPNGYYRSGAEAGMYHFPYYSYRRPWYFPGQPSFHRDTDLVW